MMFVGDKDKKAAETKAARKASARSGRKAASAGGKPCEKFGFHVDSVIGCCRITPEVWEFLDGGPRPADGKRPGQGP